MLAKSRLKKPLTNTSISSIPNVATDHKIKRQDYQKLNNKININQYINASNLLFFGLFIIFSFASFNILNKYSPNDIKDLLFFNSFLPIITTIFISLTSLFCVILQNFARGVLTALLFTLILYFRITNVILDMNLFAFLSFFYILFFFIFRKK